LRKHRPTEQIIEIDNYRIPVKIYQERRNTVRVAIGKHHAILRVPYFSLSSKEKHLVFLEEWLKKKVLIQDRYQRLFTPVDYSKPYSLTIYNEQYIVSFEAQQIDKFKAKWTDEGILIAYPADINLMDNHQEIKKLISRLCARKFRKQIETRVDHWNDHFFKEEINSIRLKYNSSNWGSCSVKKNLNFSTRLFLVPHEVREYVIVHELAHLKEMNHSKKFWEWVEQAMPDFKKHERWLKQHGGLCDF
jgi:predicted metal-dependent hydrolase